MYVIMKNDFIIDVFNLGYSLNNIYFLPHPRLSLDEIALQHKKSILKTISSMILCLSWKHALLLQLLNIHVQFKG